MTENGLIGRTVEDAIATLDRDPETARETLDPVTEDGVVTREAVEAAVSDTSKLVATAETRVELAGIAYQDATTAAAGVDDLDIVAARLDSYTDRLETVKARAADLTDDLRTPAERLADPNAVYELAVGLREVATTAQGVVRTADELSSDLDAFESWLANPDRRYDEFAEEIALVDDSLDELTAAAAALPADSDAPAADWADATMRARVVELLVADLRAELSDLRIWADREDAQLRATLDERMTDAERRTVELVETLAGRARPAWRDSFDDALAALERDLDGHDPPVDWARVQQTLETHRERAFESR